MSFSLAAVARGRPGIPRWGYVLIALAIAASLVFVFYWLFLWPSPPKAPTFPEPDKAHAAFDYGQPLHEGAPPKTAAPPPPSRAPAPPPSAAPPPDTAAPPPSSAVTITPMAVWVRQDSDSLLKAKATTADTGADEQAGGGPGGSAYGQSMQATHVADTKPKFHRFPPPFTIKKGITFGCTPPMGIDTQLPGPFWCLADEDVYSMDGNNRLIRAGSQINGQIERGLGLGQNRAVILFTDFLTPGPDFLPIPLDSIGADSLGQNGVPMDINEHTWQKIKMAGMAALIEGAAGAAQSAVSSGGNQYIGSFGNQTQSLASIFAQHDVNIPVTGYRGPARSISVYVNHYIDLSDYYEQISRGHR